MSQKITAKHKQTLHVFGGYENNADMVGAINILRAGHALFACEVNPDGDQQQEPTEVTQQSGNASLDAVGIPRL